MVLTFLLFRFICWKFILNVNMTDVPKHHVKQELCVSRPSYRDGRRLTAVKVYTVHQESKYLLVQNVPAVGAREQLEKVFSEFGTIHELHPLDDFPAEKFTEVYLVKYQRIQSARFAKRKLDDHAFFGGSLHVSYAPEYETVQETREKLQDRRKVIAAKIRKLEKESEDNTHSKTESLPAALHNGHQGSLPAPDETLSLPAPLPPSQLHIPSHPYISPSIPPPPPPIHPQGSVHLQPSSTSAPSFQGNGNNGFENRGELSDFDFTIPPPPVPSNPYQTVPGFGHRQHGFGRVPSANATFPPWYDARLREDDHQQRISIFEENVSRTVSDKQLLSSKSGARVLPSLVPGQTGTLASNSNAKAGEQKQEKLIIKKYKPKGPAPRFVPRQIKESKTSKPEGSTKRGTSKVKEDDDLNREIRKEAFRLGEAQGPALPSDPETKEQLLGHRPLVEPQVEVSVLTSVKAIRKRLSKFISETVPKKQKIPEEKPDSSEALGATGAANSSDIS